jgi:hypothetical protein
MDKDETKPLLDLRECRGTLASGDDRVEVQFNLRFTHRGELEVSSIRLPLDRSTVFLMHLYSREELTVERLSLSALAPDGARISSEGVFIKSMETRHNAEEIVLELGLQMYDCEISWSPVSRGESPLGATRVCYWVQGLRGFRVQEVVRDSVRIAIGGDHAVDDPSTISGLLELSPFSDEAAFPVHESDDLDRHVRQALDLLSLAQGRFLRWCVREEYAGNVRTRWTIRVRNTSAGPKYAVFSFLHLQPVVDLLASSFTPRLVEETGVDVAIEWMLMNPPYYEAEFITLMTALEHLLDRFAETDPIRRWLFPKEVFRARIRPALLESLKQELIALKSDEIPESFPPVAEGRLGDLNRRTIRDLLMQFVEHYRVPVSDLEAHLRDLLRLRNRLVHAGQGSPDREPAYLLKSVVRLRELVVRCVLSIIGYEGHYNTYLPGERWVAFPPEPKGGTDPPLGDET